MKLIPTWPFAIAALVIGMAVGAYAQQIRVANLKAKHAEAMEAVANEKTAVALENQRLRDEMEDLRAKQALEITLMDERLTREVADAKAETENRLRGVAAGTVRVRYVQAACPKPSSDLSATTEPASVADGAGIELTPDAGQDVLHLRQALIEDRAKIEGLQEYIRKIAPRPALGLKAGAD